MFSLKISLISENQTSGETPAVQKSVGAFTTANQGMVKGCSEDKTPHHLHRGESDRGTDVTPLIILRFRPSVQGFSTPAVGVRLPTGVRGRTLLRVWPVELLPSKLRRSCSSCLSQSCTTFDQCSKFKSIWMAF